MTREVGPRHGPAPPALGSAVSVKLFFLDLLFFRNNIFSVRANGLQEDMRVGSEKTSYFSNPSWPANDSSLQFATHTIKIEDDDVCQVSR